MKKSHRDFLNHEVEELHQSLLHALPSTLRESSLSQKNAFSLIEDQLKSGQTLEKLTQNYKDKCHRAMDFQKAKIHGDNNENAANYRCSVGDQKFMIRNRGLMKDSKKVRYGEEATSERE